MLENLDHYSSLKMNVILYIYYNLVNPKKKTGERREKIPEDEIANRLFELFQNKNSYTFQEINNEFEQQKVSLFLFKFINFLCRNIWKLF